jgi:hypothetical protein
MVGTDHTRTHPRLFRRRHRAELAEARHVREGEGPQVWRIRGGSDPTRYLGSPVPLSRRRVRNVCASRESCKKSSAHHTIKPCPQTRPSSRKNHNRYGDFRSRPFAFVALPWLAYLMLLPFQRTRATRAGKRRRCMATAHRSLRSRSHHVGPEALRMESLCFHIVLGLGLLLIAIAVADGIRILLAPHIKTLLEIYKLEKRRASRPILLAEWNVPKV